MKMQGKTGKMFSAVGSEWRERNDRKNYKGLNIINREQPRRGKKLKQKREKRRLICRIYLEGNEKLEMEIKETERKKNENRRTMINTV